MQTNSTVDFVPDVSGFCSEHSNLLLLLVNSFCISTSPIWLIIAAGVAVK